jgi:hypothetical protein
MRERPTLNINDRPVQSEVKIEENPDTGISFEVKTITIKSSVPTEKDFRFGSFADSD